MTEGSQRNYGAIWTGVTLLAVTALILSVIEFSAFTLAKSSIVNGRPGVETAARLSPLSWSYPLVLAEISAGTGRPEAAIEWYQKALKRNPACGQCAVGLAEVESKLGNDPEILLARAVRYGRSNASIRMRAGTLYARLGMHEQAAVEFKAAALGQRENQREFFLLLHRIYPDWFVSERILPDALVPLYFNFARARLNPFAVQRVWERYQQLGVTASARDDYVTYLLRHGLAHEAWSLAFDGRPPPLGTILNGDFESPIAGGGFSWRISDGEGVSARVRDCPDCVDQGQALSIIFDGETDVHYTGSRVNVAVQPSTMYRLSARVKSDAITSARGPSLTVAGLKGVDDGIRPLCELYVVGEELRRSFDWRTTSLMFRTPESCTGIVVMVTRLRTRRLDKFIGGELWVDDVALEALASGVPPAIGESPEERGMGLSADQFTNSGTGAQGEIGQVSR